MTDHSYFALFTRRNDEVVSYAEGETVFEVGDPADCFFVVRSGTVGLWTGDQILETVGRNGIFGEMAIVDGSPRSATAKAASDAEVVRVDESRFRYLVQEAPYFAQEVMRVMASRLRATTQRLV